MSDTSEAKDDQYHADGLQSPAALVALLLADNDLNRHVRLKAAIKALGRASKPDQQLYKDAIVAAGLKGARDMGSALTEATEQAKKARRSEPREVDERYVVADGCLWIVEDDGGRILLAQFASRILSEIIRDDGVERVGLVQIRVTLPNGRSGDAEITAEEAPKARKWTALAVGAHATIMPMSRAEDHVWTATQILSRGEWKQTVRYAHTGWRLLDGKHRFLTASGAIGEAGLDADVNVDLGSDALNRYSLPDPNAVPATELRAAVNASLDLLRVAPHRVVVPILAAVYRAPLPVLPETTPWVYGPSGSLKSALTAIAQQHFGALMDAKSFPAAWTSTANALEGLAAVLHDVLMVIDDYAPQSVANPALLDAAVDRVVRGSANSAGRQRMNQDATIRPPKPPRAQLMASGEDLASGGSLRARMTPVPVEPGDVDTKILTDAQRLASAGVYALCIAGYVQWIAGQQDENPGYADGLRQQMADLRDELAGTGHLRLPEATAGLLTGWREFLRYAVDIGAVTPAERKQFIAGCTAALGSLAGEQQENTKIFDPVQIYIEAISGALVGGYAHLADQKTGDIPEYGGTVGYRHLGWQRHTTGENVDYRPQGERIGWIDGKGEIYLYAATAHTTAAQQSKRMRRPLSTSKEMIHKELHRQQLLASISNGGSLVVSKRVGGASKWVLHLKTEVLFPPGEDQDPPQDPDAAAAESTEATPGPSGDEQGELFDPPLDTCQRCGFGFDQNGHASNNCEGTQP